MRRFRDYLTAVSAGRFSEAIAPRQDMVDGGIEVWFRPRPTAKGGR